MFKVLNVTGCVLILLQFIVTSVGNYFFFCYGSFQASKWIVLLFISLYVYNAVVSFTIAGMISFAIWKIWCALKNLPSLQRSERIMWLHMIAVISYAGCFILGAVMIILTATGSSDDFNRNLNIQGIIQGVLSFAANLILLYFIN